MAAEFLSMEAIKFDAEEGRSCCANAGIEKEIRHRAVNRGETRKVRGVKGKS
jgi:hypothetical protein